MELDNLRSLYVDELQDLYSAEKQLVKALPKMAQNASNQDLKKAFTDHLAKTQIHVERLEQVFETLDESPGGKKCVGMEALIEEADELLSEDAQPDVLDAGLISRAQHVEHYEIAGYGTVRSYAVMLGETEHAEILQQTLEEEEEADELLTELAETSINLDAILADSEESESGSRMDREVKRRVASDRESSQRSGSSRSRGSTSREDRSESR